MSVIPSVAWEALLAPGWHTCRAPLITVQIHDGIEKQVVATEELIISVHLNSLPMVVPHLLIREVENCSETGQGKRPWWQHSTSPLTF